MLQSTRKEVILMKVTRNVRLKGGNLPDNFSVVVPVTIDFTGCTDEERNNWAASERVIAWQRVARIKLSPDFLRQLAKDGLTIHARDCGRMLLTRDEKIAKLTDAGIPAKLATFMVDNPEEATNILGDVDVPSK